MELIKLNEKVEWNGEVGVIVEDCGNGKFVVDFGGERKKFNVIAFENGMKYVDANLQQQALVELDNYKKAKINQQKNKQEALVNGAELAIQNLASSDPRSVEGKIRSVVSALNLTHIKMDKNNRESYRDIEKKFRIVRGQRGIRYDDENILLFSTINTKDGRYTYSDKCNSDTEFIYTGEGLNGDQSLTGGNKEIVDAKDNNKTIHLFVTFGPDDYYYQGIYVLEKYDLVDGIGDDGKKRKEYKFTLRKVN